MFGCSDVYHWMGRAAKAVCLPDCSAGWTTSGRCDDDEFFRPSYSSQACQPRPALSKAKGCPDPEPKGDTPLDPQRFSGP